MDGGEGITTGMKAKVPGYKKPQKVKANFQHLIHTLNDQADREGIKTARGNLWNVNNEALVRSVNGDDGVQFGSVSTTMGGSAGWIGGAIAGGGGEVSAFRISDNPDEETKFLSAGIGAEFGAGVGGFVAGVSVGGDLVSVRKGGFRANVGGNLNTGVSLGAGGVEANVGGFGLAVGKKMGINTPIGGVSFDLEEGCSNQ